MNVHINNDRFNVEVKTDHAGREEGMKMKEFASTGNGMLFVMDTRDEHGFWMKDCIVPLDIIFIWDHTITKIYHSCPPCKSLNCPSYKGYGNLVLELSGGVCKEKNISVGDKLSYHKN